MADADAESDTPYTTWEAVESLQGTQFYRLYKSPASALAIFRKRLTGLAKSYVMTLLYAPRPVLAKHLELGVSPSSIGEHRHAIDLLHQYHIFKDVAVKTARAFSLTPNFARSLRAALVGAGSQMPFGELAQVPPKNVLSVAELDELARRQWEGLLGYMVGSTASSVNPEESLPPPPPSVIALLKEGGLVDLSGTASRGQTPHITKEGFAFVLQDVSTQIWALLFLYVSVAPGLGMDKVDVLGFIFFVSSLELGLAYSRSRLDDTRQQILDHLAAFGIVYQPSRASGEPEDYFYPTRLATTLTSDTPVALSTNNTSLGSPLPSSATSAGGGQGFVIVETNYRVYAYTSSPLQIALLSLFITLRSRHPNLVTGKMTKTSIGRAVRLGITAEQIIAYLTSHAHPQMLRQAQAQQAKSAEQNRQASILPATVVDQIHLWQLERDRMVTTTGMLLRDFKSLSEYEVNCRYADENGVLVWKNDKKRMFFITQAGWPSVQSFILERRGASNAANT